MKTLEVLEKVVQGKRISESRKRSYKAAFDCLAKFTDEWPDDMFKVNAWVSQMPDSWSDETVQHYFQTVLAGGNYIQKTMGRKADGTWKWFNVFIDAERPRTKKKQRRYFNSAELIGCLKAARGETEVALVSVLIDSACRIGELEGLTGRDVGVNFFVCQKGKTGQRHYRLDSRICLELKKMAGSDDGVVFKNRSGGPATVACLSWYARKIIQRAGITGKKVGAHTIRHSGASLIAKKTGSALAVKALLQHDKIETSMLYIHDAEDEIQQDMSPMAMINVVPAEQTVLWLENGESAIKDENVVESIDLIDDMFERIPDKVGIRPMLGAKDLLCLRRLMVEYTRAHRGDSLVYQSQDLLKRMLRKAK
jgi:integrase